MKECTYLTAEQFDEFSSNQENTSIFQNSGWAKTKSNWKPLYIGYKSENELQIACMFLLRKLPLGLSFAYSPRGPISNMSFLDHKEEYLSFFKSIRSLLARNKVLLAKIDPHTIIQHLEFNEKQQVPSSSDEETVTFLKKCKLHHCGYNLSIKDSIQPRIQLGFPISNNIEERIGSKTMKKVRASLNKGVIIKEETTSDSLIKMVKCTENRHHISLRNKNYFDQILNNFKDDAIVLACYSEDILLSACLLVKCKTTTEILYSGYDDTYKKFNSTYPLRYASIEWAKKHGCHTFNFGGVEGTLDDGLTMFKSSFNPQIDIYIGEFDILPIPLLSHLIKCFYPILKKYAL